LRPIGQVADVERTDWDGVGHYRRTVTGGTFAGGNRETFVAYNTRDAEVNPTTGFQTGTNVTTFVSAPSSTPWILDRASSVKVTEGGVTATTQSCFDGTTGQLRATRILKGPFAILPTRWWSLPPTYGATSSARPGLAAT
jgi:hypothetical protein